MPKCQPTEIHPRDANLQYYVKNEYIPSYTIMSKTGVYPLYYINNCIEPFRYKLFGLILHH